TARAEPCPRPNDDESAAKYLFKLSHDVILSLDRVGNILCINQRGVQLSGYSETELRGANVFELLLFPEDRQIARAMLADKLVGTPVTDTYLPEERNVFRERLQQLKTGGTLRFERNFVRKNGDIVPVEVSVTAIRGGYFQAILRDISERKRSEALLAGEKRLLEMIATGVGLKEILNTLCLIIEEQRAGTLASVLLLNADGVHLDCIAGPSLP